MNQQQFEKFELNGKWFYPLAAIKPLKRTAKCYRCFWDFLINDQETTSATKNLAVKNLEHLEECLKNVQLRGDYFFASFPDYDFLRLAVKSWATKKNRWLPTETDPFASAPGQKPQEVGVKNNSNVKDKTHKRKVKAAEIEAPPLEPPPPPSTYAKTFRSGGKRHKTEYMVENGRQVYQIPDRQLVDKAAEYFRMWWQPITDDGYIKLMSGGDISAQDAALSLEMLDAALESIVSKDMRYYAPVPYYTFLCGIVAEYIRKTEEALSDR